MLITRKIGIDMGHRIPKHKSKCKNLHGHRYEIIVGVDDKVITTKGSADEGMVIDLGDVKEIMMKEIDVVFDHGFCMYTGDEYVSQFREMQMKDSQKIIFVPFIPTVENLAKHWFEIIKPKLVERKVKIFNIRVWETPNCMAEYRGE